MTIKNAMAAGLISLLACAGALAAPHGERQVPNPQIKALLDEEDKLDSACRGGQETEAETDAACAKRDVAVKKLEAAGWCHGHENAAGYQRYWAPCGSHPDPNQVEEAEAKPTRRQWFVANVNFSACSESSRSPAEQIRMIQGYGKSAEVNDLPGGAVEVGEPIGRGKTSFVKFFSTLEACTASLPRSRRVDPRYE